MSNPTEQVCTHRASSYYIYVANQHGLHQNKTTTESGAESPTTARPLEMDDDDVQETSIIADDPKATTTSNHATTGTSVTTAPDGEATAQDSSTEAAPPKPPRPLTESQKNEIKAVLRASSGKVEPAFNALLGKLPPLCEKPCV
jgi:hypothetical protein